MEHAVLAQDHAGRLGQAAQLGAGERRAAGDHIHPDLDVHAGAEAVDLGGPGQHLVARWHVGNRQEFVGEALHAVEEQRQLGVGERAAAIRQLQRHAQAAVAQRLFDIDFHHARHALLLHGDADQLLRHFHGDLVVRNEDELGLRRHALDHLAEAHGVRVVERRIDLVEHAERRRIEVEDGEHQGDRGQRLFAAGEQVDGGVLLARRLRHDLDAGIEDLVAGEDQARLAAAEKLREQGAEMAVDGVVGLLQLLARFAVDAPDGVFQRADGLG
jgi:hypothetical protein